MEKPKAAPAPTDVRAGGRVLVVLSSDSSIYEEGLAGLRSASRATLTIAYLNVLEAEETEARPFLERADSAGYRLVVAIGAEAAQQVYTYVKRTPVVFSMLSVPRALPVPLQSLCGVSMRIPMEEYFRVLKEIAPQAKRVHSFYSTPAGDYLTGEGEYADLRHGLVYSHERIEPGRFGERLNALKGNADAFYVAADPLYDRRRFEELSAFARKNGLILFSGFRSLVFAGATFGIAPDYYRIGSLTGQMVARIIAKESNCAKEGIVLPDRSAYFFYLNWKFSRESGVRIPAAIRERARNIRLLRAGIEFFNEGKLKSARAIFDHLLEKDPGNAAALYYRARVAARLNGSAIDELLAEARRHMEAGLLSEAGRAFARVLDIQPRHAAAVQGLIRVSRLQQEQAEAAYRSGRLYVALTLLEAAVRSHNENEEAVSRLREIRVRESYRVSDLIATGRAMYTQRNYPGAIRVLSDALLLSPGNKTATEYLRLSHRKGAAMERLRQKIRESKSGTAR